MSLLHSIQRTNSAPRTRAISGETVALHSFPVLLKTFLVCTAPEYRAEVLPFVVMHHQPKITLEELEYDGMLFLAYSGYPTQVTDAFPKTLGSSQRGWYLREIQKHAQYTRKALTCRQEHVFRQGNPWCSRTTVRIIAPMSMSLWGSYVKVGVNAIFYHRPLAPLDPSSILVGMPSPEVQDSLSFTGSSYLSVPKRKLGPMSNFFLEKRNRSCQGPFTEVSPTLYPCLTVNPILNSDDSDFEGYISSTFTSLELIRRKTDLLRIALWVVGSDFLRFQFLEPIVGGAPMSHPPIVDDYGLKGQSIYTAFFDHLDMETFRCWECGHVVEEDLEAAIVHQRIMHFRHEPYTCHGLDGHW